MSDRASHDVWNAISADTNRFWSKVDKRSVDGCWPWTAATTRTGKNGTSLRGNFRVTIEKRCRTIRASRIALILATHTEYVDLDAGHSDRCTTTLCCRPSHLTWISKRQNIEDYVQLKRRRRAGRR